MVTPLPIVELRQYTLHPGQRDTLIDVFEREFIESQEAVGMKVIGQFCDLDKPDRFVWIRGFTDMPSRAEGLNAFYSGPVWKRHRDAANATMLDSDNVLLLHAVGPDAGFTPDDRQRAAVGADTAPPGLVVATIYYFENPVEPEFVQFFESAVSAPLTVAGIPVLAAFVTETAPNNYPPLPVRQDDHVFAWFSSFADQADYDARLVVLAGIPAWKGVADALRRRMKAPPEILRLQPTRRSQLRGETAARRNR